MSLASVLAQFGHWFSSLFKSLDKAWAEEEPQLQSAMIDASGFIQDIKENLDKPAGQVLELLTEKYTHLSPSVIQNGLETVASGLDTSIKIVVSSPVQTLQNIMDFIKPLTGNQWADKLQSAMKLFSAELAPGTPFEKIALFAQYVYTNFIQKHN